MAGLKQTTAPTIEPVTVEEAKRWARIDEAADDSTVETLITAAREIVEKDTERQLITATWQQKLDCFPQWELFLDRPPLIAITTLAYLDTAGTSQSLVLTTDFLINTTAGRGYLTPAYTKWWPSTRNQVDAVTITYTAGYGAAASTVPATLRQAMLLLIAHWYEQRTPVVVGTITKEIELSYRALVDAYSMPSVR